MCAREREFAHAHTHVHTLTYTHPDTPPPPPSTPRPAHTRVYKISNQAWRQDKVTMNGVVTTNEDLVLAEIGHRESDMRQHSTVNVPKTNVQLPEGTR